MVHIPRSTPRTPRPARPTEPTPAPAPAARTRPASAPAPAETTITTEPVASRGRSDPSDAADARRRFGHDTGARLAEHRLRTQTVVRTGAGDDDIRVSRGAAPGGLRLDINGRATELDADQSRNLVIDAGEGNDHITVDPSVRHALTLRGGAGDDTIRGGSGRNRIEGGDGDDYLEGGRGDDRIEGGAGRDTIYGLDGADSLHGGDGRDYLDGGAGNDHLEGDAGNDQLIGGRGADTLLGGAGDDVLAGGAGPDEYHGGEGSDRIFHQRDDTPAHLGEGDTAQVVEMGAPDGDVGHSVITDSDRVRSDVDALRSMPHGRELLESLDSSGHLTRVEVLEDGTPMETETFSDGTGAQDMREHNTVAGAGAPADVRYDTSLRRWRGRGHDGTSEADNVPPIVALSHELSHAQANEHGRRATGRTDGERNSELAASGLPLDHDGNPRTPRVIFDPINEQGIREDLGLPARERY